jgi:selenocysteine lyase/cysteine desulfurase
MEKELIYFDNAATAWPKPESVYQFMIDFYRCTGVNPGRSGFDLALEAGSLLDRLRKRLTKFFGGDEDAPERLCFGYNATDALNLIIAGSLASGDHVITTNLEHNSVIRPINHLVRDGGVTATFVSFDGAGFVDPDDIARAIRPNTRLVIVNHGSNVIGTVQPVKEIGRICRERGITFAIDTAQTAGVIPISMKEMNIDVLAFTGHKALMGCMGIGGLCVRQHVHLRQTRSGGTGVRSAYPYHPATSRPCGRPTTSGPGVRPGSTRHNRRFRSAAACKRLPHLPPAACVSLSQPCFRRDHSCQSRWRRLPAPQSRKPGPACAL